MAARLFLGVPPVRSAFHLTTYSRIGVRYYTISQKVERNALDCLKNMEKLNLDLSKQTKAKSFEAFRNSPSIKSLFGDDIEKITQAYNEYLICRYNRYLHSMYGGNAAHMM
jgi:hypothetical protein